MLLGGICGMLSLPNPTSESRTPKDTMQLAGMCCAQCAFLQLSTISTGMCGDDKRCSATLSARCLVGQAMGVSRSHDAVVCLIQVKGCGMGLVLV